MNIFIRLWLIFALMKIGYAEEDHPFLGAYTNAVDTKQDKAFWHNECQEELKKQINDKPIEKKAKNIILFLGDGTGIATFTAARLVKGYRTGNFESEVMAWERFPYSGIYKTYSSDMQTTDSAASATAYLTGSKGNQQTIGVDANVRKGDCTAMNDPAFHTTSVLSQFQAVGKSTGILTSSRVTHASPAPHYAHTAHRDWESDADILDAGMPPRACADIAKQLIENDVGKKINVVMGGGRREFLPNTTIDAEGFPGHRLDQRNLIKEWQDSKPESANAYVWKRDQLMEVDINKTDYLFGLFESSHMNFVLDNTEDNDTSNPSLAEMTETALRILQKNDKGFYLFVEGGNIDRAHHQNQYRKSLEEAVEFERAVQTAVDMTDAEETLILVTADHSQPFTINGYTPRESDILGLGDESNVDDMDFTTLLYTTGPGFKTQKDGKRPDPAEETDPSVDSADYRGASAVPMTSSHHNGEDVVLYASGPQSHLFSGVHENAYIPHLMRYAACLGDGLQFCNDAPSLGFSFSLLLLPIVGVRLRELFLY